MFKRLIYLSLALVLIFSFSVNAIVFDFTDDEYFWEGENRDLDSFIFEYGERAYVGRLYNMGWAGRFGGVSIQAKDLDLPFSSSQNRFLKLRLKTDDLGKENAFDHVRVIYWLKGSADPSFANIKNNFMAGLLTDEDYIDIILDLGWKNENDQLMDTLRLDFFCSSIDKAASNIDGAACGFLYFRYIGLFDSQEEALAYELVLPTLEPTKEPTPVADKSQEPEPTKEIKEEDKKEEKDENKKPIAFILIASILVIAVIIIGLIVFLPKKGVKK